MRNDANLLIYKYILKNSVPMCLLPQPFCRNNQNLLITPLVFACDGLPIPQEKRISLPRYAHAKATSRFEGHERLPIN